mmetsp:Transcript_113777/g.321771  ORF Transcript_113777/g.321771 Transcript_113777/m.321771 type:complete len:547 (+) Transcript_113777:77-1717(+)
MGDDQKRLFVGNLPHDIRDDEIRMIFNTYGNVTDISMLEGKNCCFVEYDSEDGATAAMQVLHEVYRFREDAPRPIRVSIAKPRGSKGDGRGDESGSIADHAGRDRAGQYDRDSYSSKSYNNDSYSGRDRDRDRGYDGGRGRDSYGADRGGGGAYASDRGGYSDQGGSRGSYYDDKKGGTRAGPYDDKRGSGYSSGGSYNRDRSYDDRGYDRGTDRGYDRGQDRGYDRGQERGYDRDSRKGSGGDTYAGSRGAGKPSGKGGYSECKLYIGNLPGDITRDVIDTVFKTYGAIEDIHVMPGRSKGDNLSCAFVRYYRADDAQACILAMESGYEIRPGYGALIVKIANDREKRPLPDAGVASHRSYSPPPNGHSQGYGGGYDRDARKGVGRGYERDSGKGGHGYERDSGKSGIGYDRDSGKSGIGYDRDSRKGGSAGYDRDVPKGGKGGSKDAPGSKVYLGSLPPDITKETLDTVFRTYGKIEDIHIMTGRSEKTDASCAFVRYSTAAEAESCVAAMEVGYEISPGEGNIIVRIANDRKPQDGGKRYQPY